MPNSDWDTINGGKMHINLPDHMGAPGRVLAVNEAGTETVWGVAPVLAVEPTEQDVGKVLMIGNDTNLILGKELPDILPGFSGFKLAVKNDESGVEWVDDEKIPVYHHVVKIVNKSINPTSYGKIKSFGYISIYTKYRFPYNYNDTAKDAFAAWLHSLEDGLTVPMTVVDVDTTVYENSKLHAQNVTLSATQPQKEYITNNDPDNFGNIDLDLLEDQIDPAMCLHEVTLSTFGSPPQDPWFNLSFQMLDYKPDPINSLVDLKERLRYSRFLSRSSTLNATGGICQAYSTLEKKWTKNNIITGIYEPSMGSLGTSLFMTIVNPMDITSKGEVDWFNFAGRSINFHDNVTELQGIGTISGGAYLSSEIPEYNIINARNKLIVNSDGTHLEWLDEPSIPPLNEGDEGKLLGVDEYRNLEWVEGLPKAQHDGQGLVWVNNKWALQEGYGFYVGSYGEFERYLPVNSDGTLIITDARNFIPGNSYKFEYDNGDGTGYKVLGTFPASGIAGGTDTMVTINAGGWETAKGSFDKITMQADGSLIGTMAKLRITGQFKAGYHPFKLEYLPAVQSVTSNNPSEIVTERAVYKQLVKNTELTLNEGADVTSKEKLKVKAVNNGNDVAFEAELTLDKPVVFVDELPDVALVNFNRLYYNLAESGTDDEGLYKPTFQGDSVKWTPVGGGTKIYVGSNRDYEASGMSIPTLDNAQLKAAYDDIKHGKEVLIKDEHKNNYYHVFSAEIIDSEIYLKYMIGGWAASLGTYSGTYGWSMTKYANDTLPSIVLDTSSSTTSGTLTNAQIEIVKKKDPNTTVKCNALTMHLAISYNNIYEYSCSTSVAMSGADPRVERFSCIIDVTEGTWRVVSDILIGPVIDLGSQAYSGSINYWQREEMNKNNPNMIVKLGNCYYHFQKRVGLLLYFICLDYTGVSLYAYRVIVDMAGANDGTWTFEEINPSGVIVDIGNAASGTLTDDQKKILSLTRGDTILKNGNCYYDFVYRSGANYTFQYSAGLDFAKIDVNTDSKTWSKTVYDAEPEQPLIVLSNADTGTLTDANVTAIKKDCKNMRIKCNNLYYTFTKYLSNVYMYECTIDMTVYEIACNVSTKTWIRSSKGIMQNQSVAKYMGLNILGSSNNFSGCRYWTNAGTPKSGFEITGLTTQYPLIVLAREGNIWLVYHTGWDWRTTRLVGSGTIPNPTYDSTNAKLTFAKDDSYYNLAVTAWVINN